MGREPATAAIVDSSTVVAHFLDRSAWLVLFYRASSFRSILDFFKVLYLLNFV